MKSIETIDDLDSEALILPRMPVKVLDQKKVLSLQKKYITIPDHALSYYPDPIADDCNSDGDEEGEGTGVAPADTTLPAVDVQTIAAIARAKRPRATPVAPGARKKPGPKPKAAADVAVGTPSILSYYARK